MVGARRGLRGGWLRAWSMEATDLVLPCMEMCVIARLRS